MLRIRSFYSDSDCSISVDWTEFKKRVSGTFPLGKKEEASLREGLFTKTENMKLLYFTIQFSMAGGLARIVTDKVNWLVAHGYEVTICNIEPLEVVPYYPLDERVKLMRGNIATTPGGILTRMKGVLRARKRLSQVIEESRPDIIINAHCPLVTWLLPFSHRSIPKVMEIHQSLQGLEVFDRQFMSPMARRLHLWSIRWIYQRYDRFVVLTHGDMAAWGSPSNARVIPNFANFVDGSHPLGTDCKTQKQILLLARLMPQKRIDLMMQVWALLAKDFPDWHVTVLGEGLSRSELEQLRHRLEIEDSFSMPGEVKEVKQELATSDIFCLTSEYEGFGIVVLEAQQMGLPVVAFRYVGVDDLITDGENGYVVPFGDVHAYAERLRRLMSSAEERKRLAENGRASVQKFDKECVMQRWVELFQQL